LEQLEEAKTPSEAQREEQARRVKTVNIQVRLAKIGLDKTVGYLWA
jgi:hypothetical protein